MRSDGVHMPTTSDPTASNAAAVKSLCLFLSAQVCAKYPLWTYTLTTSMPLAGTSPAFTSQTPTMTAEGHIPTGAFTTRLHVSSLAHDGDGHAEPHVDRGGADRIVWKYPVTMMMDCRIMPSCDVLHIVYDEVLFW